MAEERLGRDVADIGVVAEDDRRLVVEDAVTRMEIDLREQIIRKTWKFLGFAHSRTYELDTPAVVRIRENSKFLEGYRIASFDLFMSVRGGTIRIWSTGDFERARLVRERIELFLKGEKARSGDGKPFADR